MQVVDLPIVAISTELGAAIKMLRKLKRGALLAKHKEAYFLFSAGNIVVGRSKGVKTLAELPLSAYERVAGPETTRKRFALTVALPDFGGSARKDAPDYVLGKVSGGSARLRIRDSALAVEYVSGPKDYYCDGPWRHDDFPPPSVSEGDPCPHQDGYKIVSST